MFLVKSLLIVPSALPFPAPWSRGHPDSGDAEPALGERAQRRRGRAVHVVEHAHHVGVIGRQERGCRRRAGFPVPVRVAPLGVVGGGAKNAVDEVERVMLGRTHPTRSCTWPGSRRSRDSRRFHSRPRTAPRRNAPRTRARRRGGSPASRCIAGAGRAGQRRARGRDAVVAGCVQARCAGDPDRVAGCRCHGQAHVARRHHLRR